MFYKIIIDSNMFNNVINKKNQLIEKNQEEILNMHSQFGGNNDANEDNKLFSENQSEQSEQYEQLNEYNKNRKIYDNLKADLNNQIKHINKFITGGNDESININNIFL